MRRRVIGNMIGQPSGGGGIGDGFRYVKLYMSTNYGATDYYSLHGVRLMVNGTNVLWDDENPLVSVDSQPSYLSSYNAEKLLNNGNSPTSIASRWIAYYNQFPDSIIFDLGYTETDTASTWVMVETSQSPTRMPKAFTVSLSPDNSDWTEILANPDSYDWTQDSEYYQCEFALSY